MPESSPKTGESVVASVVTRRYFIGGVLIAAGTLGAEEIQQASYASGLRNGESTAEAAAVQVETDPTLVMERFEKNGIAPFYREFVLDQTIQHELGIHAPFDVTGDLSAVMSAVAADKPENLPTIQLEKIRTGWSEEPSRVKRQEQAQRAGYQKAIRIPLVTGPNIPAGSIDYYTIEGSIVNYSQVYPCAVLAIDGYVQTVPDGGEFAYGRYVQITSYLVNRDLAYISMLHEGMHAYEADPFRPEIKAIMRMQDAAAYRLTKKTETFETLKDYFDGEWAQGKRFKGDYIINDDVVRSTITSYLTPGEQQYVKEQPKALETLGIPQIGYIAQELGIDLAEAPLDPGETETLRSNYNRLSYLVGKKRLSLIPKQENGTLTPDEQKFVQDPRALTAMQLAMDDINHFYVGPIQTPVHTLPRTIGEMDGPESRLGQGNLVVQRARMLHLSALPATQTFQELRTWLGLPR